MSALDNGRNRRQCRRMSYTPRNNEMTVERLERALLVMAEIVVLHGPAYAPLLNRLERELEQLKRDDPVAKARRLIETLQERAMVQRSG